MLLTKRPEEISWEDVLNFCGRQLPESAILDYKREIPARLENVIAAMANTYGGTVLIGLDEDRETTKPLAPYLGVAFQRGLQERVQEIMAAHVRPLVEIQVAVPTNEDGTRCFIVLRVPQSPLSPHGVDGEAVYIRTGNRNQPESLANPDRIVWLANHRQRAIEERERLKEQSRARCAPAGEPREALLTLSLCPMYPSEEFASPDDLLRIYRDIRVRDYYGTGDRYPLADHPRTVQDGVIGVVTNDDAFYYAELNASGLYFTRQSLLATLRDDDDEDARDGLPLIRASEIVTRVDEVLTTASRFYAELGYGGPLQFSFGISRANERALDTRMIGGVFPNPGQGCLDAEIRFESNSNGVTLLEDRRRLVLACHQRVCNAYHADIPDRVVERYVVQQGGAPI